MVANALDCGLSVLAIPVITTLEVEGEIMMYHNKFCKEVAGGVTLWRRLKAGVRVLGKVRLQPARG